MFISYENAQAIVDEMKNLLGYNINIMNEEGLIIASTNPVRIGQQHEGAMRLLEQKMDQLVIEPGSELKNTRPGINFPIIICGKLVGVIGVTGLPEKVLTPGNVIKRMTELMVESLQQKENQLMLEAARNRFLISWIGWEGEDPEEFHKRGKSLGIDIDARHTLFCVDPGLSHIYHNNPRDELQANILFANINELQNPDGRKLCCIYDDVFVFILPENTNEELVKYAELLREEISRHTDDDVYIGISSRAASNSEIGILYKEARAACEIARKSLGKPVQFYSRSDPEFIAGSISEDIRIALINSVFGGCSKETREEYVELLQNYFQHNGNLNEAADAMYIHRNTMQYRLNKMTEMIGYSVNKSRDRFILYLVSIWLSKYK